MGVACVGEIIAGDAEGGKEGSKTLVGLAVGFGVAGAAVGLSEGSGVVGFGDDALVGC